MNTRKIGELAILEGPILGKLDELDVDIRSKLPLTGSIRKSPYMDDIVEMRLQGRTFVEIERYLASKGSKYKISSGELSKELKEVKKLFPFVSNISDIYGNTIDADNELRNLIVVQKYRLDQALKREDVKRGEKAGYIDKRVQNEIKLMMDLIKMARSVRPNANTEKEDENGYEVPARAPVVIDVEQVEGEIVDHILKGFERNTEEKEE